MVILLRFFSKKVREIEESLLQNIRDLEFTYLNAFIQNMNYLDPDRSFTSVLNEIESNKSFKCLCSKKTEDAFSISNYSEISLKSRSNFINSLNRYPFIQITINKDDILIRKLRYLVFNQRTTSEIRVQCLKLAKLALETLKMNLKEERKNFKQNFEPNEDLKTSYDQFVCEKFEGIVKEAKNKILTFEKKLIKST